MMQQNSQAPRRGQRAQLRGPPVRTRHIWMMVTWMLFTLVLANGCILDSFEEGERPSDGESVAVTRSNEEPILEPIDDLELQPQLPDFSASNITISGCTRAGGLPRVRVTIKNTGFASDRVGVDLFVGAPYPPPMGTRSALGKKTRQLATGESEDLYFTIPAEAIGYHSTQWFDVLVDTTQVVEELNEGNDHTDAELELPDCSFD